MLPIVGSVSGLAFQQRAAASGPGVTFNARSVLAQAWRLYTRLFTRTFLMALVVFGAINILLAPLRGGHAGVMVALLAIVAATFGCALLQGALVEIVRGLHEDGDDEPSGFEALARASGRVWKLVRLSLLMSFFVGLASLLFVVPGLVLATRWGLAVPVAMLEEGTARSALGRSRTLVRGNGWTVFRTLFGAGLLTFLVTIPLGVLATGMDTVTFWFASTLIMALTAPYTAHTFAVTYYALREPDRPVVLEPGQRWKSVWEDQPAATPAASVWAEYERKFDEHESRWGSKP